MKKNEIKKENLHCNTVFAIGNFKVVGSSFGSDQKSR